MRAGRAVVLSLALSLSLSCIGSVSGGPQKVGPRPEWIRHTIHAGERLEGISTRYGVTRDELLSWNSGRTFKRGTQIRIRPRELPPPRHSRRVEVGKKDTWKTLADRHDVSVANLVAWNPRFKRHFSRPRPPKGAQLLVWSDSGVTTLPPKKFDAPLPTCEASAGGVSIGKPSRGRLQDGVALPPSSNYTIRSARLAFGSSLTVAAVQQGIAAFRRDTGFAGEIWIGAMSRRTGRRLRPHRSHQSGRDADIRLPALAGPDNPHKLKSHEIDWYASWALMDAFVRTGDVQVIFIERKFFGRLKKAAMRLGASDKRIDKVFDHIRHSKGHVAHMHVRFRCRPGATECKD